MSYGHIFDETKEGSTIFSKTFFLLYKHLEVLTVISSGLSLTLHVEYTLT
jgi:hypothetical protein